MIKIAIADDHALVRKSLSLLLSTTQDIRVVAEASNGLELLKVLKNTAVDIVLLDIQMPEMDGFETAKQLNKLFPKLKILVLTMLYDSDTINKVIEYVDGFYTKNTNPEELENAILKLEKSGFYFEQSLAETISKLEETSSFIKEIEKIELSSREKEIIILTAKELSNKEIADQLFISKRTVERHKENLRANLDTRNFTSVIMHALKYKLISLADIFE
ncbi:MAG TPA: response regulator transcription factor [Edaphocola sp.]|nr:response regulator transcription factor [Edaphocola sp.]